MGSRGQFLFRITALVTTILFTLTNSTWAQTPFTFPVPEQAVSPGLPDKFNVPEELGTIQREYHSPETGPYVVVIQDAHAVTDAQARIQELIQYLQTTYQVDVVALEGGAGKLDPTLLRTFPDRFIKRKVVGEYFQRGELSGAEMAAILNSESAAYYGMEDWDLYEADYFAYLRALREKEGVLVQLKELKGDLDRERNRVFSRKLIGFHEHLEAFENENAYLLELLNYLTTFEGARQRLSDFPELWKLFESLEFEKESAGEKGDLDSSVRQMAESFKKKYSDRLDLRREREFNAGFQAFVTGEIEAGSFLKVMTETAKSIGVKPKLTPLMLRLLGQAETLATVKGTRLFDELQTLLQGVEKELIRNPEEAALVQKYHRMRLLRDLASLEITRDQLDEYRRAPEEFLSIAGEAQARLRPALEFYRLALERDQAFRRNLVGLLKKKESRGAIVLAGGFHAKGIEMNLKEEEISFAVVAPRIQSLEGQELYQDLMEGKLSYKGDLKTTFYDAFARHSTLRLVSELSEPEFKRTLKLWRDEILRTLSKEGRIVEARVYLQYLDLLLRVYYQKFGKERTETRSREEILKDIEKELNAFRDETVNRLWHRFQLQLNAFIGGLETLIRRKELTLENVSSLLSHVGESQPYAIVPQRGALIRELNSAVLRQFYLTGILPEDVSVTTEGLVVTTLPRFVEALGEIAGETPAPEVVTPQARRVAEEIREAARLAETPEPTPAKVSEVTTALRSIFTRVSTYNTSGFAVEVLKALGRERRGARVVPAAEKAEPRETAVTAIEGEVDLVREGTVTFPGAEVEVGTIGRIPITSQARVRSELREKTPAELMGILTADSDPVNRYAAAQALGENGLAAREVLPELMKALAGEKQRAVRHAIVEALGSALGEERDMDQKITLIGLLGENATRRNRHAISALVRASLEDPEFSVQNKAASALLALDGAREVVEEEMAVQGQSRNLETLARSKGESALTPSEIDQTLAGLPETSRERLEKITQSLEEWQGRPSREERSEAASLNLGQIIERLKYHQANPAELERIRSAARAELRAGEADEADIILGTVRDLTQDKRPEYVRAILGSLYLWVEERQEGAVAEQDPSRLLPIQRYNRDTIRKAMAKNQGSADNFRLLIGLRDALKEWAAQAREKEAVRILDENTRDSTGYELMAALFTGAATATESFTDQELDTAKRFFEDLEARLGPSARFLKSRGVTLAPDHFYNQIERELPGLNLTLNQRALALRLIETERAREPAGEEREQETRFFTPFETTGVFIGQMRNELVKRDFRAAQTRLSNLFNEVERRIQAGDRAGARQMMIRYLDESFRGRFPEEVQGPLRERVRLLVSQIAPTWRSIEEPPQAATVPLEIEKGALDASVDLVELATLRGKMTVTASDVDEVIKKNLPQASSVALGEVIRRLEAHMKGPGSTVRPAEVQKNINGSLARVRNLQKAALEQELKASRSELRQGTLEVSADLALLAYRRGEGEVDPSKVDQTLEAGLPKATSGALGEIIGLLKGHQEPTKRPRLPEEISSKLGQVIERLQFHQKKSEQEEREKIAPATPIPIGALEASAELLLLAYTKEKSSIEPPEVNTTLQKILAKPTNRQILAMIETLKERKEKTGIGQPPAGVRDRLGEIIQVLELQNRKIERTKEGAFVARVKALLKAEKVDFDKVERRIEAGLTSLRWKDKVDGLIKLFTEAKLPGELSERKNQVLRKVRSHRNRLALHQRVQVLSRARQEVARLGISIEEGDTDLRDLMLLLRDDVPTSDREVMRVIEATRNRVEDSKTKQQHHGLGLYYSVKPLQEFGADWMVAGVSQDGRFVSLRMGDATGHGVSRLTSVVEKAERLYQRGGTLEDRIANAKDEAERLRIYQGHLKFVTTLVDLFAEVFREEAGNFSYTEVLYDAETETHYENLTGGVPGFYSGGTEAQKAKPLLQMGETHIKALDIGMPVGEAKPRIVRGAGVALVVTDGITEAMKERRGGEEFGDERVRKILGDLHSKGGLAVFRKLLGAVESWKGGQAILERGFRLPGEELGQQDDETAGALDSRKIRRQYLERKRALEEVGIPAGEEEQWELALGPRERDEEMERVLDLFKGEIREEEEPTEAEEPGVTPEEVRMLELVGGMGMEGEEAEVDVLEGVKGDRWNETKESFSLEDEENDLVYLVPEWRGFPNLKIRRVEVVSKSTDPLRPTGKYPLHLDFYAEGKADAPVLNLSLFPLEEKGENFVRLGILERRTEFKNWVQASVEEYNRKHPGREKSSGTLIVDWFNQAVFPWLKAHGFARMRGVPVIRGADERFFKPLGFELVSGEEGEAYWEKDLEALKAEELPAARAEVRDDTAIKFAKSILEKPFRTNLGRSPSEAEVDEFLGLPSETGEVNRLAGQFAEKVKARPAPAVEVTDPIAKRTEDYLQNDIVAKGWRLSNNPLPSRENGGWKVHVSGTPENAAQILDIVLPILKRHNIYHKVMTMRSLRDSTANREEKGRGKFITIYPRDDQHSVELVREIDQAILSAKEEERLTVTQEIPQAQSDKQVGSSGFVSARYGQYDETRKLTNPDTGEPEFDPRTEEDLKSHNRLLQLTGKPVREKIYKPNWADDPFDKAGLAAPARAEVREAEAKFYPVEGAKLGRILNSWPGMPPGFIVGNDGTMPLPNVVERERDLRAGFLIQSGDRLSVNPAYYPKGPLDYQKKLLRGRNDNAKQFRDRSTQESFIVDRETLGDFPISKEEAVRDIALGLLVTDSAGGLKLAGDTPFGYLVRLTAERRYERPKPKGWDEVKTTSYEIDQVKSRVEEAMSAAVGTNLINSLDYVLGELKRINERAKLDEVLDGIAGAHRDFNPGSRSQTKLEEAYLILSKSRARAEVRAEKEEYPRGRSWEVIDARPDHGGLIYTVRPIENEESYRFEGDTSLSVGSFARLFPFLAKKLGFKALENGGFESPDAAALNARIAELLGVDPEDAAWFWSYSGVEEASETEVIDHWAQGQAVFSSQGPLHFHDLNIHLVAYLILHLLPEVAGAIKAQAGFLSQLAKDRELMKYSVIKKAIQLHTEYMIDSLDPTSASISQLILSKQYLSNESEVFQTADEQLGYYLKGIVGKTFSLQERAEQLIVYIETTRSDDPTLQSNTWKETIRKLAKEYDNGILISEDQFSREFPQRIRTLLTSETLPVEAFARAEVRSFQERVNRFVEIGDQFESDTLEGAIPRMSSEYVEAVEKLEKLIEKAEEFDPARAAESEREIKIYFIKEGREFLRALENLGNFTLQFEVDLQVVYAAYANVIGIDLGSVLGHLLDPEIQRLAPEIQYLLDTLKRLVRVEPGLGAQADPAGISQVERGSTSRFGDYVKITLPEGGGRWREISFYKNRKNAVVTTRIPLEGRRGVSLDSFVVRLGDKREEDDMSLRLGKVFYEGSEVEGYEPTMVFSFTDRDRVPPGFSNLNAVLGEFRGSLRQIANLFTQVSANARESEKLNREEIPFVSEFSRTLAERIEALIPETYRGEAARSEVRMDREEVDKIQRWLVGLDNQSFMKEFDLLKSLSPSKELRDIYELEHGLRILDQDNEGYQAGRRYQDPPWVAAISISPYGHLFQSEFMRERLRRISEQPRNRTDRNIAKHLFWIKEEVGLIDSEARELPLGDFIVGKDGRLLWTKYSEFTRFDQKMPQAVELVTEATAEGVMPGLYEVETQSVVPTRPLFPAARIEDLVFDLRFTKAAIGRGRSVSKRIGALPPEQVKNYIKLVRRELESLKDVPEKPIDLQSNLNFPGREVLKTYLTRIEKIYDPETGRRRAEIRAEVPAVREARPTGITSFAVLAGLDRPERVEQLVTDLRSEVRSLIDVKTAAEKTGRRKVIGLRQRFEGPKKAVLTFLREQTSIPTALAEIGFAAAYEPLIKEGLIEEGGLEAVRVRSEMRVLAPEVFKEEVEVAQADIQVDPKELEEAEAALRSLVETWIAQKRKFALGLMIPELSADAVAEYREALEFFKEVIGQFTLVYPKGTSVAPKLWQGLTATADFESVEEREENAATLKLLSREKSVFYGPPSFLDGKGWNLDNLEKIDPRLVLDVARALVSGIQDKRLRLLALRATIALLFLLKEQPELRRDPRALSVFMESRGFRAFGQDRGVLSLKVSEIAKLASALAAIRRAA